MAEEEMKPWNKEQEPYEKVGRRSRLETERNGILEKP